ncbi:Crp/Fnr family transcriptional regulator [Sphingomonas sp. LT1P40]|uniref:Crp/Fnr family transcriptional regulator n=1 Tax=Alteristakelama amylovorans TaxID=3096166 RepID=UPI002FC9EBEA
MDRLPHNEASLLQARATRVWLDDRTPIQLRESDGSMGTCFPETAILALSQCVSDRHYEVALVGREGAIGWPGLLSGLPFLNSVVSHRGSALVLSARSMGALVSVCPDLRQILLRYIQCLTAQLSTTIVSSLRDSAHARVARRLLMLHDRLGTPSFSVTHRKLADTLNLRRATVTECLHELEGRLLIRSTRALIAIRDREGLTAVAGNAYGAAELSYDSLIGRHAARPAPAPEGSPAIARALLPAPVAI